MTIRNIHYLLYYLGIHRLIWREYYRDRRAAQEAGGTGLTS
jgi:hypothetical protein